MVRKHARPAGRGSRIVMLAALGLIGLSASAGARQVSGDPNSPDLQVLARGPIHEAFAEPIVYNPSPGVVAPKPPPSTVIDELPPAQRPEGVNVEWIPGYWAWDEERNDYIWISGIWRDFPPGRQWVPGYWSPVENGSIWTPGFWASSAANGQFNYLPAPPQSLEAGPNTPQPGPDFIWTPGSWVWTQDRYAWQPGYWVQANPNWVWTPSSYVSTPSGYIANDGYWDYNLNRRGLAFAPVAFGASTFGRSNYAYSPTNVLPVAGLLSSLFIRPNYGHYYFGDYYNAASVGPRANYVPWFNYGQNRVGYDPLYSSMSALNSGRPEWDRRLRDDYRERLENRQPRPATTFEGQRAQIEEFRGRGQEVRNLGLVQPLNQWATNPQANHRIVPVAEDHRAEIIRRQQEFQNLRQERARIESQARMPANIRPEEHQPRRIELPRSPIATAGRAPGPGFVAPPPHPEAHQAFRPTFNREPNVVRPGNPTFHPEPNVVRPGNNPVRREELRPAPIRPNPRPGNIPERREERTGQPRPEPGTGKPR